MTIVRPAMPDDSRDLAALRWAFRVERAPAVDNREPFIERCTAWMRRELEAQSPWRAWAALDATGVIVGQVWVQIIEKLPNPVGEAESHAYISNLFVAPHARGGVGVRLLETAIAWAAAQRVDSIVLWPSPRSVALYERHGFRRDGLVMERSFRTVG